MAVIKHHMITSHFNALKKSEFPNVYLVYGESYLIKQVFEKLCTLLLADNRSDFNVELLEGGSISMGDIIEHVTTLSFLSPRKIIAVKNIPFFVTRTKNAEKFFSPADLDHLSERIKNKGIPPNHFAIFMSENCDKRKKIYKTIHKYGLIIDAAVPLGVRKTDLEAQREVLQSVSTQILSKLNKQIDPRAFHALTDRIGFNLDLLSQNLEKLAAYTGNKNRICVTDVMKIVKRDRKDPVFNLTNAVLDKNVKHALVYLNSLLTAGYHPLQILKSFENQFRKMLLVKTCIKYIRQEKKISGLKTMNFNVFRQSVLPYIIAYDQNTKQLWASQGDQLSPDDSNTKAVADLLLASNPKNAYPVFQIFLKSENFSFSELTSVIVFLSDLDFKMKSESLDGVTQIEHFIIMLCSKEKFFYDDTQHANCRNHFQP